jgi:hypothetical protein
MLRMDAVEADGRAGCRMGLDEAGKLRLKPKLMSR